MSNEKQIPVLVICGPTAAGKTSLALQLAQHFPLEIISADSRQVYRQMDIGTAKATAEEQAAVHHHLIDLVDPDQEFSVADYVALGRPCIEAIAGRGKLSCVVGGTGLYIKALLGGLAEVPAADPELRKQLQEEELRDGPGTLHRMLERIDPTAAARIHPNNLVRLVRALEICILSERKLSDLHAEHRFADQPYRSIQIAPHFERAELFRRIDQRAELMLKAGLVDEVAELAARYSPELKTLQTLGYREVLEYLAGDVSSAQLLENIRRHTQQYAKRQLTWFRKESQIIWVDSSNQSGKVIQSIENLIFR